MFTLPTISAEVPTSFTPDAQSFAITELARVIANAGMFEAPDLRVGTAGVPRMIERAFERWAVEDKITTKDPILPIAFCITTLDTDDTVSVLRLAQTNVHARWYVGHRMKAWVGTPLQPLLELATATLYSALDALCYAPKPPEYLVWAAHCWWGGYEDERVQRTIQAERQAAAKAIVDGLVADGAAHNGLVVQEALRQEGLEDCMRVPNVRRSALPTRKRFDHRYPRWMQAPRRDRCALDLATKRDRRSIATAEAIETVEAALRSRYLRRPNMDTIFPEGVPNNFGCVVRYQHGDFTDRLIHHWAEMAARKGHSFFSDHGRWQLQTADDVVAARRAITAHCRLLAATRRLLYETGHASWQRMGY